MSEDNKNDEQQKIGSYFSFSEAIDDVKDSYDAPSKVSSGAKLLGKTVFNVGLFATRLGVDLVKEAAKNKK